MHIHETVNCTAPKYYHCRIVLLCQAKEHSGAAARGIKKDASLVWFPFLR